MDRDAGTGAFAALGRELAERDRSLGSALDRARDAADRLRRHAEDCVAAFRASVHAEGAEHLAHVEVGAVEPDPKHVDCVSFVVRRGRFEAVCVAKAKGTVTLVGPFKKGKTEKPCSDHSLDGTETQGALEALLERLIRVASER